MPHITREFSSMCELWEFVLSFEDGSLPPDAWNERTVAAVAVWYLALLPVEEAVGRLEAAIQRNRRRFRRRSDSAHQAASDPTWLWPRILQHVLIAATARDPLPLANRLLRDGGTILATRVA